MLHILPIAPLELPSNIPQSIIFLASNYISLDCFLQLEETQKSFVSL